MLWKKCSGSLAIWKMPIKTTMRFHLTPLWLAYIQKSSNNTFWKGCGVNGTLTVGGKVDYCSCDGSRYSECSDNQESIHRKTQPTPGTIFKGNKIHIRENDWQPCIYSSIVHTSKDMESTQMTGNRGMDTDIVAHLLDGILLDNEEWNIGVCNKMVPDEWYYV